MLLLQLELPRHGGMFRPDLVIGAFYWLQFSHTAK